MFKSAGKRCATVTSHIGEVMPSPIRPHTALLASLARCHDTAGGGEQAHRGRGRIDRNGTNQGREVERRNCPPHTAVVAPISIEQLRLLLSYDPLTGILRWRVSPARRVEVGDEAGSLNVTGYRRIRLGARRRVVAHRVAWALFYGEWPPVGLFIDHANGVKDDNRIVNLRLATHGQNRANSVPQSAHGVKGVCQERNGRWRAQIWRDGALRGLGTYDTKEEAAAAFAAAHRELHGEFSFCDPPRSRLSAQRSLPFCAVVSPVAGAGGGTPAQVCDG